MLVKIPDEYAEDFKMMIEELRNYSDRDRGYTKDAIFTSETQRKEPCSCDTAGAELCVYSSDCAEVFDMEEFSEYINELLAENGCDTQKVKFDDETFKSEVELFLEECEVDLGEFEVYFRKPVYHQLPGSLSLFRSDSEWYIKRHNHDLANPRLYITSSYDAPLMNRLRSLLKECEILDENGN